MDRYSIDQAQTDLPQLVDRALKGEAVVIVRHGQAVELRPVADTLAPVAAPRRPSAEDMARLAAIRVGRIAPEDAGATVSRMRDEDWR